MHVNIQSHICLEQDAPTYRPKACVKPIFFLLISNLTNRLRLHQFLGTKTTEMNKSLKTDANGAY